MKRELTVSESHDWLPSTAAICAFVLVLILALCGCTNNDPDSAACLRNLQEIGSASRVFELTNGALPSDFQSLQPYLSNPRVLVCPSYTSTAPVTSEALKAGTVTYEIVRPGLRLAETNSVIKVFVRCPRHGYFCHGDGSVHKQVDCATVP